MLIPSGWIHAVYTPCDTLVVGGNFLHDWNIPTQLKLVEVEIATKVPQKFRFPHFVRLAWYVADGWDERLKAKASREDKGKAKGEEVNPPERIIKGLLALCDLLDREVGLIHDAAAAAAAQKVETGSGSEAGGGARGGSPADTAQDTTTTTTAAAEAEAGAGTTPSAGVARARRLARENVPGDRVRDPAALVARLRTRLVALLSHDDETQGHVGGRKLKRGAGAGLSDGKTARAKVKSPGAAAGGDGAKTGSRPGETADEGNLDGTANANANANASANVTGKNKNKNKKPKKTQAERALADRGTPDIFRNFKRSPSSVSEPALQVASVPTQTAPAPAPAPAPALEPVHAS